MVWFEMLGDVDTMMPLTLLLSAYQTVLVNSPPADEKNRLKTMLMEIRKIEDELLD